MWRFLSSISRAFKNHVHSPRPSAGLYVEEEQEALELNDRVACPFSGRRRSVDTEGHHGCSSKILNSLFVNKRDNQNNNHETTCNIKQSQDFNTGREEDDKRNWSCHHDFWRMFQGSGRMLEALSWGSAMLLGTDRERRRYKSRLLFRVIFTAPGGSTTTIRTIKSGTNANQAVVSQPKETRRVASRDTVGVTQDGAVGNLEAEALDVALEEFQSMCTDYTATTESLLGIEAASHGDFSTAVDHLRSSCALGNTSACFNLGLCYETGSGILQDLDKAKHYYRLAAMDGHSMALYNLGLMFLRCSNYDAEENLATAGCECGCDKIEGLGLMEKAAQLGLAEAQMFLGIHHVEDNQDIDRAVPYFKAAAEQNDVDAQYFLAICYEQGWGVEVNECRAAQLYSQATSSGHGVAMYNLAVFNEHGLGGLPQDKSAAIELYQKSADLGCDQAKQRLEDLKTSATTAEDWKMKIETFRQLYLQHHKDEDTPSRNHPGTVTLSPSASSPNLTEHLHKDGPFFFGTHQVHLSQNKSDDISFEYLDGNRAALKTRKDSHLGSDGEYDYNSLSPHSERSDMDESFEIFPTFNILHRSLSHPNMSMVACNM